MKKLIFLFLSLLTVGSIFQACDDSKTYAEMLEDEKNAVNKFIKDSAIHVISEAEFEANGKKTKVKGQNGATYDEYVAFTSNGVYMQIVYEGDKTEDADENKFVDGDNICVRYLERNISNGDLTAFDVPLDEWMDATQLYTYPAVFRYVQNESASYSAGTFIEMDYFWANAYGSTAVPQGWLLSLPYLYDGAHVRLIIPSKMGHDSAVKYVIPYYYDIRRFLKAKS